MEALPPHTSPPPASRRLRTEASRNGSIAPPLGVSSTYTICGSSHGLELRRHLLVRFTHFSHRCFDANHRPLGAARLLCHYSKVLVTVGLHSYDLFSNAQLLVPSVGSFPSERASRPRLYKGEL